MWAHRALIARTWLFEFVRPLIHVKGSGRARGASERTTATSWRRSVASVSPHVVGVGGSEAIGLTVSDHGIQRSDGVRVQVIQQSGVHGIQQ